MLLSEICINREEAHLDQCTQEHILQAISYLDSDEWLQLFHQPDPPGINNLRVAVSTVLSAVMGMYSVPQPNPITGLVPCGCGGKAKYINSYYDDVWMHENYVGCPGCYASSAHISTSKHGYSKEMETEIKLKIRDNWNVSRGYTAPPRPGAIGPETGEMAPNGDEGAGE